MRYLLLVLSGLMLASGIGECAADLVVDAKAAMKKATAFYSTDVAVHGGYVYFYTLDFNQRWGEGLASKNQVWVQPPGTPTVGLAYLKAHEATGDSQYLDAATRAAEAIVYGQLKSGGWTNCIDFDPQGARSAAYRNGKGRGKNNSSLDDGQTQSALLFLIRTDKALRFQHTGIHEAAKFGLKTLLDAQFANGGFPQVWTKPVSRQPVVKANYPKYDWRTEGRIKEYWNLYTLNDNVCGYVFDTLVAAYEVYGDETYLQAIRKLGDFLLLAQMPEPQPAWAQQYNFDMQPVWARRFEPPAITGDESQEVIETLLKIVEVTGDPTYLTPIAAAMNYLERSVLPDGRIARYYELGSNKPLYMNRRGRQYFLTHDDSDLPSHYGWKTKSRLNELKQAVALIRSGKPKPKVTVSAQGVRQIISSLDDTGRWISVRGKERLVGQAKIALGHPYLSSEVFSRNLSQLAGFVRAAQRADDSQ